MPPKSTPYREVRTKDSSAEVAKVNGSPSKWTKDDLVLLGVDYQYHVFDDIQIRIEDDMPMELLQSDNLFILD